MTYYSSDTHSLYDVLDIRGEPYSIVYVDPPWSYYGDPNKGQAAGKHYSLMSMEQISALPVFDLMRTDSVCLLWCTSPKLDMAIDVIRNWGLHFRGVSYVWVKAASDGHIIRGQGVRPTTVKPTSEFILVASKLNKGRPLPIATESQGQVVVTPRPDKHSSKPDIFYSYIEELFGDVSRIELFARNEWVGWDAWGNEPPCISEG